MICYDGNEKNIDYKRFFALDFQTALEIVKVLFQHAAFA